LASSRSSETALAAARAREEGKRQPPRQLPPQRLHRALAKMPLGKSGMAAAAGLSFGLTLAAVYGLPFLCLAWRAALAAGIRWLGLKAQIEIISYRPLSGFSVAVPYLRAQEGLVDPAKFWFTAAAAVLLFALTFLFSDRFLPLAYVLRAILLVQMSSVVFFGFFAARFPHTASSYLSGLINTEMGLIVLTPAFLGLTYYIFDFGILKKLALTLLMVGHLAVLLPLQVLLHAVVLQISILYMPVLYMFFGLPLQVMVLIAFYAWGTSWKMRREQ